MATASRAIPKKPPAKPVPKDNYARVVATVVIIVLAGGLALYFFTHAKNVKEQVRENYLSLPQLIVDNEGQVVRLSVVVQVDEKDKGWSVQRKDAINEIFRKTVNELDPQNFRSDAGRVAVQEEIKDQINQQLKVDKVKAILYNDLIMQKKLDE